MMGGQTGLHPRGSILPISDTPSGSRLVLEKPAALFIFFLSFLLLLLLLLFLSKRKDRPETPRNSQKQKSFEFHSGRGACSGSWRTKGRGGQTVSADPFPSLLGQGGGILLGLTSPFFIPV